MVAEEEFGLDGDVPLAGDWDGDGVDTIGVYRPGDRTFYLSGLPGQTTPRVVAEVLYGLSGDTPIVGDWDGDRVTTIGILR